MNAAGQEKEPKIKQREAFYCNVKLLLMFMVVYGHMIEGMTDSVEPLMQVYRVIYSVHMPLFLFLSGLFLKSLAGCLRQAKQMLRYYVTCQTAVVILGRAAGEQLRLDTPVWTLWYLLSLACMAVVGWCWYAATERWQRLNNGAVKTALLILAVLLACEAGKWAFVGRWLSLSRTICFLPYFLAGMFCPAGVNWKRRSIRLIGLVGLGVYLLLYLGPGRDIPTEMFYQADSYGELVFFNAGDGRMAIHVLMRSNYDILNIEQGSFLRLTCMMMAVALGLGLMTLVSERRFPFSKLGADTVGIYLLHAPLVKLPEQMALPIHIWIALSPFLAAYVIFLLYKLFQWRRSLYSLTTVKKEERGTETETNPCQT